MFLNGPLMAHVRQPSWAQNGPLKDLELWVGCALKQPKAHHEADVGTKRTMIEDGPDPWLLHKVRPFRMSQQPLSVDVGQSLFRYFIFEATWPIRPYPLPTRHAAWRGWKHVTSAEPLGKLQTKVFLIEIWKIHFSF